MSVCLQSWDSQMFVIFNDRIHKYFIGVLKVIDEKMVKILEKNNNF
jgi:hypothetical protein